MGGSDKENSKEDEAMSEYQKLLDYYKKCFSLVDCFHFNSETSQKVYRKVLPNCRGDVLSITHGGIQDHRERKSFDRKVLHIGFIGNSTPYKGLPLLISILQDIGKDEKWDLSVWGGGIGKHPSLPIYYRGKFDSSTIADVYGAMDVLIVPSVWKETFSLVTLEALSYGVPVIVSDNVGAQDIVKTYNQEFVYRTESELKNLLLKILLDRSLLREYNDNILSQEWQFSIEAHAKQMIKKFYEIGKG